ncbi:DUF885 domain-containing protein [Pedosphaera parvula]|uniref:DUF885 domain-containing protein n=1 Tax=Pedosphaera parvula (strain Ellin514) TaxID=320771 RepID=B9XIA0_PEDPL|nr:DUF885 family protein [Pedosphaera parvula]EEF60361.1 protein of unknown function DUF885 [Pedosphaera parvula Ellin514]
MSKASSQFEGLLDGYFERVLEENPTFAAYSGIQSSRGRLGRATLEFETRQQKHRQKALLQLNTLSPRELSNEQQLDRLALRSQLLRETEDFDRKRHTLDPNALDHVLNLLLHELQRGEDEPKRVAQNLRSILKQTPRFLNESASLIDRPERVWRKIMEQTVAGSHSLFEAVATFLKRVEPQSSDGQQIKDAQRAFSKYHKKVMSRPLAPESSFSVGAPIVQRRIRDQLGLDYSLGEIEALALSEVNRIGTLLKQAASKFGKGKSPEQIIEKARAEWNPGADLLGFYRKETSRVASAFKSAKAVTFPQGDELQVRPVPEFMRHLFPTAAYSSPGAFERRQRGIFWVNDLSVTKTTEAEKKAERQQHFGLSLTCAHEAYPGHHLQFVIANQHPRKWRRLFAHAVFYEGWTLWCEQMMVDLKIDRSPWLQVQQLHDALWRCHRILVDLRLQTGRYTYEKAVAHMMKNLGFTRARAEADVNWYTASPTVPMSYWLGRLENERLRQRLMVGRGWKLQKFNDWLISFGTIPQAWIEKYGLD